MLRQLCVAIGIFLSTGALLGQSLRAQGADGFAEKLAWQIALERECFSPGLVDGKVGPKTAIATREYQRAHGLPTTGRLDDATQAALKVDPAGALGTYAVLQSDLDGITPHNTDWNERAKQGRSGYFSVIDSLAEKFHTSQGLMKQLNPAVDFENLTVGTALNVPMVQPGIAPKAQSLRVELAKKLIVALDKDGKMVGLVHCSIAANVEKRPSGATTVVCVVPNPDYTFDPKYWPEVHNVDHRLIIPPGPRNPVGMCWIGLDLPGYGMHGAPWPEMIGKTGSHGCFRLTNWDALRLAKMIRVGATVVFVGASESPAATAASGAAR